MYSKYVFKSPKVIVGATVVSSSGVSILSSTTYGANYHITLEAISGDCYFSTLTTAPTSASGFKLVEGDCIDIQVPSYMALIGDSTSSTIQGIIWD